MATVNKSTVTVNKPVVNKNGEYIKNKKVKFKRNNEDFKKQVKEDTKLIESFEKVYAKNEAKEAKKTEVRKVSISQNLNAKTKDVKIDEQALKESAEILNDFRTAFEDVETEKRWKFTIKRSGQFCIKLIKDFVSDLWGIISNLGLTVWLLLVLAYKKIKELFKKKKKD